MFLRPRPLAYKSGPTSQSGVAAESVAVRRPASALLRPLKAARSTRTPSLAFSGVKECPVPGVRTGPSACRTAAASSTSSLGATILRGLQVTPPDQLDHLPPTIFIGLPCLRMLRAAAY